MKYAVKTIAKKKLVELYTPAGSNKHGFFNRDEFEQAVGTSDFHSFQVWRSTPTGTATSTYALTLEQVKAIRTSRNREIGGLKSRITKLTRENLALRPLAAEAQRLAVRNKLLEEMNANASVLLKAAKSREEALKPQVQTIRREPQPPLDGIRSLTGKGSGQLCEEAVGKTDKFRGMINTPM